MSLSPSCARARATDLSYPPLVPSLHALLSAALFVGSLVAFGATYHLWKRASPPREVRAEASAHEDILVDTVVGGRSATRRKVPMVRVTLRYALDGDTRTFHVDRAPSLAQEKLAVGAVVPAYVDASGRASLEPTDPSKVAFLPLLAGLGALFAAVLLFFLRPK